MTDTNQEVRETPEALTFTYTNWRGETAERRVKPDSIRFGWGSSEWHPEPQWLMSAMDLDKGRFRDFAVKDIAFASAPPPAVPDAVGVRATRLDWIKPDPHEDEETLCAAPGLGGRYSISHRQSLHIGGQGHLLWWAHDGFTFAEFRTVDDAKAAAQADFDRRILSSIETTPSPEPQASNAGAEPNPSVTMLREAITNIDAFGNEPSDRATVILERKDSSTFEMIGVGNEPLRLADLRKIAALSTPEPQTGERDGEVVARAHMNVGYLYGIADALMATDASRAEDVRQIAASVVAGLLAERTAREAAERRLAKLQERDGEVERLRSALIVAKRSILEDTTGAVACVIWVPQDVCPAETLVDYIDAALSTPEPQTGERDGEVKAWLMGDPATGQWIEVDSHRVAYSRGMGRPAHVLAEAFKAERARADTAEGNANRWKARAEAAERRLVEVGERAREDELDARRYRHLRDNHVRRWTSNMGGPDSLDIGFDADGHDLDAALNAALRAKPEAQAIGGKEAGE